MSGVYAFFPWLRYRLGVNQKNDLQNSDTKAFIEKVLFSEYVPYSFDWYLDLMDDLLIDCNCIHVKDLGAGSKKMGADREVRQIAKHSVLKTKQAALLCRMIYHLKPMRILELGTSLGASALCMAASNSRSVVHTVDACPQTHAVAKYYLNAFELDNVKFHTQAFSEFLEDDLSEWDFVYMDGDHQYESTVNMFQQLLPRLSENAVVFIDDIYWSKGMSRAWKEISAQKNISSLDCFDFGMLFLQNKK